MSVVVITGATSGVGRATAHLYASRGASVAMMARNTDALSITCKEVDELGGRALALPLDVSDAQAVEEAAGRAEAELGPCDVWINNAMVSVFSHVWELAVEEVRRVTDVNYLGAVHGTLAALRRMRPRNRGTIVQVGSALAYRAIPLQAAYCATKHAMRAFTESLWAELAHEGSSVRVTMVQLPALNTPHFTVVRSRMPGMPRPVAPVYTPEFAAEAIVWSAEHGGREVVAGGGASRAIWAQRLVPWLVDRILVRTGFGSQQTGEPARAGRPDNLWVPVGGDQGPDGPFTEEARGRSLQFFLRRVVDSWRRPSKTTA